MRCSICNGEIDIHAISGWDKGHNAEPINPGRCCTPCNDLVVLPARLRRLAVRQGYRYDEQHQQDKQS